MNNKPEITKADGDVKDAIIRKMRQTHTIRFATMDMGNYYVLFVSCYPHRFGFTMDDEPDMVFDYDVDFDGSIFNG